MGHRKKSPQKLSLFQRLTDDYKKVRIAEFGQQGDNNRSIWREVNSHDLRQIASSQQRTITIGDMNPTNTNEDEDNSQSRSPYYWDTANYDDTDDTAKHYFKRMENEIAAPVKEKSEPEIIIEKAPVKGLFSKIGIEPTFYPDIKMPDIWLKDDEWVHAFEMFVDRFIKMHNDDFKLTNKHPWLKNAHNDGEVLEIPSDDPYETLDELVKDYKKLLSHVKKFKFKPSASIVIHSCGGCHLNFDLEDLTDKYDHIDFHLVDKFTQNVSKFYTKFPTAAWGFMHYEDSESACIRLNGEKQTSRGYVTNNQEERLEMRAFMMPRTLSEFKFHIKFANNLLKLVWNETIAGNDRYFREKTSEGELREYDFRKGSREFTKVLALVGITKKEAQKFGKYDLMKPRFKHRSLLT